MARRRTGDMDLERLARRAAAGDAQAALRLLAATAARSTFKPKVWIVYESSYDEPDMIVSVFATEDRAREAAAWLCLARAQEVEDYSLLARLERAFKDREFEQVRTEWADYSERELREKAQTSYWVGSEELSP